MTAKPPGSLAARLWDQIKLEVQAEMDKPRPCVRKVEQLLDRAARLKPKMRIQERRERNLQ